MPIFEYRSTTMDGTIAEGVLEAADQKAAIERLKNTGVIPLEVKSPAERGFRRRIGFKIGKGDLVAFTSELSTLLAAGLPLDKGLNILSEISEHRGMKEIVQSLLKSIRGGVSFSEALQKHPEIFPRFSVIFAELGSSLPLSTQILLAASEMLKSYGWIFLVLIVAAWLTLRQYIASEQGRYWWDGLKLRLMDDVIRKLETARFCRTLGTLLAGGVSLLQALNNAREVIGNRVIAVAIEAVSKGAKEGRGISEPLSRANVFPPLALSMIKVGEETGTLEQMLLQVAVTYEKSLKQAVKRFMSLLEPVMILVMGLIIGFIVISMLLAVFSISDIPL